MISIPSFFSIAFTKVFINENQDLSFESVLARESVAMITTGQSEELKKRLGRFVKERN